MKLVLSLRLAPAVVVIGGILPRSVILVDWDKFSIGSDQKSIFLFGMDKDPVMSDSYKDS